MRKTVEEYDPNAGWTPGADTAYVWDGWKLLLEIDLRDPNDPDDDFIPWKYTWGLDLAGKNGQVNSLEGAGTIGGLLAMQDMDDPNDPSDPNDAAGRFACFYDGNGNLTQLLHLGTWDPNNPEVAIRAHYEYDPYGNIVRQTGDYAAANPWRFSTKQFDAETGLGYWGYRYYSPTLGRWVSRDPIEELGGMNLYVYSANAPIGMVDAIGMKCGRCNPLTDRCCVEWESWWKFMGYLSKKQCFAVQLSVLTPSLYEALVKGGRIAVLQAIIYGGSGCLESQELKSRIRRAARIILVFDLLGNSLAQMLNVMKAYDICNQEVCVKDRPGDTVCANWWRCWSGYRCTCMNADCSEEPFAPKGTVRPGCK